MTQPVCPACRAPIALGAALCARCGLAVRPTCANCGEPLGTGDARCPRCHESIEIRAAPLAASASTASLVAVAPAAERMAQERTAPERAAPERTGARPRRHRHVALIAVVAGLVVTGVLLGLEVVAPNRDAPFDFVHRSFPALGFSLSRPNAWSESSTRVGGRPAVVFTEPGGLLSFRVVVDVVTLSRARTTIAGEASTVAVGGSPAIRNSFALGGTLVQQWWVQRPGGTFRLEFFAPEDDATDARRLAADVVGSFSLG